ncbi:MAG TPA: nuclear transport factor 2 family protein [Pyrinomonadaceae bacterium]|jgi:ketosteroid isomerase-like protein|nr:nuclear transport factor 2 family protein [Pyrinomonadaceae bacterium]
MNRNTSRICVALIILFALLAPACVSSPDSARANEQTVQAVRGVIEAQAAAWNRGDIAGYMDGYERAETTTFVSGDTITRGWQTVLERYQKAYDTPAKMGTLSFSELDIKPLSPFYAVATGRWQLARATDAPHGRFTLLFRRTSAGWRIVLDTTTSA